MNHRNDITTLELAVRLDLAFLVAGGSLDAGGITVRAIPAAESVGLSWTRPGGGASSQRLDLRRYRPGLGGWARLILCSCGHQVRSVYLTPDSSTWGCRFCLGLRHRSKRVHYPAPSGSPRGPKPRH